MHVWTSAGAILQPMRVPTGLADGLALVSRAPLTDHRKTRPKKLGSPILETIVRGFGTSQRIRGIGSAPPARQSAMRRDARCVAERDHFSRLGRCPALPALVERVAGAARLIRETAHGSDDLVRRPREAPDDARPLQLSHRLRVRPRVRISSPRIEKPSRVPRRHVEGAGDPRGVDQAPGANRQIYGVAQLFQREPDS